MVKDSQNDRFISVEVEAIEYDEGRVRNEMLEYVLLGMVDRRARMGW